MMSPRGFFSSTWLRCAFLAAAMGCNGELATPCSSAQSDCGDSCVDTTADSRNCGACGNDCGSGRVCVDSACADECPGGFDKCFESDGPACIDTRVDNANCGACGNACTGAAFCVGGACSTSCPAKTLACDVGGQTACVLPESDDQNCGACGNVCPFNATCADGACTCLQGTVCGGQCTDTWEDPLNCGACGTVCSPDEKCISAACSVTLATGVETVAADDDEVYWATQYAIEKEPTSGGPPTLLSPTTHAARVVRASSTHVYWIDGDLNAVPIDGGTGSVLGYGSSSSLVLWGDTAYDCANSDLVSWTLAAPLQKTLIEAGVCVGFVRVGDYMYWQYGQDVHRCTLPDCSSSQLVATLPISNPYFAVDDTYVYWLSGQTPLTLSRMPIGGSTVTVLATGLGYAEMLQLDDTSAWVVDESVIARVPKTGGAFEVVVQAPTSAMALTSTYLYYVRGYAPSDLNRVSK